MNFFNLFFFLSPTAAVLFFFSFFSSCALCSAWDISAMRVFSAAGLFSAGFFPAFRTIVGREREILQMLWMEFEMMCVCYIFVFTIHAVIHNSRDYKCSIWFAYIYILIWIGWLTMNTLQLCTFTFISLTYKFIFNVQENAYNWIWIVAEVNSIHFCSERWRVFVLLSYTLVCIWYFGTYWY